jgi:hypothetical protein
MMLGKLEKIDLRKAWKNEASDFTKWLAQEENLALLSDELGINIKLIQTEAQTGRYSVDILAEEEDSQRKIIIENQLEATNHDHLGKLITYSSGHDAQIIIWIVKGVREEHRQAIDWLNEHTDEDINFFAIQLELWKIGDSPYAPKFQVISKPNDWAKAVKKYGSLPLTDTKVTQFEFWNRFKEYAASKGSTLKLRKANPQHWYTISIGSSEAHLSLSVNTQDNTIGCELYIPDSKALFKDLLNHKAAIEKAVGYKLEWMELEGKKASRVRIKRDGSLEDTKHWEDYFEWFRKEAERFQAIFVKYIKNASK